MLAPDDRALLLDALRPPDGTRLDQAIGTTFTLDLHALLMAPLAFALFDWTVDEDGTPNVLAILESLRRYADRTTIFCQAGEISVPRRYQPALTFLEDRVVTVTPTSPNHVFHPKAWILRFSPEDDEPVQYRVLCASRNLTFDRSWDTLLALDGAVEQEGGGDPGLVEFVRQLAELTRVDRDDVRAATHAIADELAEVTFTPPEGFEEVRFHAIAGEGSPFPNEPDRTLVVSPFLTAGTLARLRSNQPNSDVLISRPETLDGTPVDDWPHRYVLSPLVVQPDALVATPEVDETVTELQGLHAKLFLFEQGDRVQMFTGSANATDAAFGGNVELLAELVAQRSLLDVDSLLSPGESEEPRFRDLLEEHTTNHADEVSDEASMELERVLDATRRRLGGLRYTAYYRADGDDLYDLDLQAEGEIRLPDEVRSVRCWRISTGAGHAVTATVRNDGFQLRFGHVPGSGITAFFAVEVTAEIQGRRDTTAFVVTADLVGAPEGRRQRVLTELLKSRGDVLHYLLFLLAEVDAAALEELAAALADDQVGGQQRRIDPAGTPLLESLLHALRHDPGRLDHVESLLAELRSSGRDVELLPEGLDAVWQPIWQVRQELSP